MAATKPDTDRLNTTAGLLRVTELMIRRMGDERLLSDYKLRPYWACWHAADGAMKAGRQHLARAIAAEILRDLMQVRNTLTTAA